MKDLHIMMDNRRENKQNTQRFNKLPAMIGLFILAVCLIMAYAGILFHQGRIYTIDDKSYTYSLMNQVVPVKISLLDPVWGSAAVDSVEEAAEYYEMIRNLPVTQSAEGTELYSDMITGAVSFVEGDNVEFTAGAYIVIDGVMYGNDYTRQSIKSHTERLCKWLFTVENLVNLIGSHNRVVLRRENERINLSVDQKQSLRNALLQSSVITDNAELSQAIRTKGRGMAQIEIYVLDKEEKTPKVYIVLFENGFCAVHDERFVGTIMYLDSNVLEVGKEFLKEEER